MMRFLLILDRVENPASANALMGCRLAAELTAAGHTVHLLELWDGQTPPPAPPQGVTQHALPFADERLMNAALENGAKGGTPVPLRLARLAAHPTAAVAAFRQLVLHPPGRTVASRRAVEQLDAQFHFDAVCAVCAPYRAAFALETARTGGKKLLWQMDPCAANETYAAPGGYDRERQLLGAMDRVYITQQAAADFAPGGPLAALAPRAQVLAFPSLVPPAETEGAVQPQSCVFCGTLYRKLREPGALLALFAALGGGWTLTMAGGGWEAFAPARAQAEAALGPRLQILGPVPPARAAALEAQAGVLVSIGNATANQVPSKLFEYAAAGKPVLHLSAGENDAALPYLARWPLALCVPPGEPARQAALVRPWLEQTAGKVLPFAQAAACFPEFTPEAVAQDFLRGLGG